jgi:hypothetical protein
MEPGYGALGYSGYLNRFPTPRNEAPGCPSTYSFRYGNVGVIALDANEVSYEIQHNLGYSAGAQTTWLAGVLTGFRAPGSGVDFVVAVYHHCTYSSNTRHGSDGGVREKWVPLFDQFGVDLVINGHAHLYERTFPIRNGQVTREVNKGDTVDSELNGTTYITAGGGGAPVELGFHRTGLSYVTQKDYSWTPEAAPWSAPTRSTTHAFLSVTVTPAAGTGPTSMRIQAVTDQGTVIDDVTLTRSVQATA